MFHKLKSIALLTVIAVASIGSASLQTSCASGPPALSKAQDWLNSPEGQSALAAVTTTVEILAPQYAPAIQAATLGLRSLETKQAPTPIEIASAIETFGGRAKIRSLAPVISTAVQSALNAGVPPKVAVETVTKHVDAAVSG